MADVRRLIEVAEGMAITHSLKSIGVNAPRFSDQEIWEIAKFNSAFWRMINFGMKKKQNPNATYAPPEEPERLVEMVNAIEIADGADFVTSRLYVRECIASGALRAFEMLEGGALKRFDPARAVNVHPGPDAKIYSIGGGYATRPAWAVSRKSGIDDLAYNYLAILKDDYEYFMEYGEPRSVDETQPAPPVQPTPPINSAKRKRTKPHSKKEAAWMEALASELEKVGEVISKPDFVTRHQGKFPDAPVKHAQEKYRLLPDSVRNAPHRPRKGNN